MNSYKGKFFSFLGDSISTLEGFNPDVSNIFYTNEKAFEAGIRSPRDTWWWQVAAHFDALPLVNNSWSGSRVTKLPHQDMLFPSGCSDKRTSELHRGGILPDVIIIYLGTNDWYNGAPLEHHHGIQQLLDQSFTYAYGNMLTKIKSNYPEAELWCCTLSISDANGGDFPFELAGIHMREYCEIIKTLAKKHGCRIIDIYSHLKPYDTIDGYHPSAKGMKTLAEIIIEEAEGQALC